MVVYKFVLKLFRVTDVADADADADDGNSDNKAISVQLSWGLTELGNSWKSGKFMNVTSRPWSLNTYALTKVWN